jgi:hypothetical protein
MRSNKRQLSEKRAKRGQSLAAGDTGNGRTGVAAAKQGISNRRGDKDTAHERAAKKSRSTRKSHT